MKKIIRQKTSAALTILAGSALFGTSVNMFLLPQGIVTGGATGIATAAGKLWGVPVGLGILLVNLPIFAMCIKQSGIGGLMYSIIGTMATSIMSDILYFLPPASSDPLLCALLGGAVMGIGSGILIASGFTTGGTDLAAYLLRRRYPSLSTGRMILYMDAAIIILAAAAMRNFTGIMYSAICTVTYSASLDMVHSASRRAKAVFVISESYEKIAYAVSKQIDRGVTILSGFGYYTGKARSVIMCVVGKHEEFPLRKLILEIDPAAFIVIEDAACVLGQGFGDKDTKLNKKN